MKSVVHTGTKMELIKYAASTERGKIEEKPSKIPCKQGENRVIMCFELSGNKQKVDMRARKPLKILTF